MTVASIAVSIACKSDHTICVQIFHKGSMGVSVTPQSFEICRKMFAPYANVNPYLCLFPIKELNDIFNESQSLPEFLLTKLCALIEFLDVHLDQQRLYGFKSETSGCAQSICLKFLPPVIHSIPDQDIYINKITGITIKDQGFQIANLELLGRDISENPAMKEVDWRANRTC